LAWHLATVERAQRSLEERAALQGQYLPSPSRCWEGARATFTAGCLLGLRPIATGSRPVAETAADLTRSTGLVLALALSSSPCQPCGKVGDPAELVHSKLSIGAVISRQERYRADYARTKVGWRDSLKLYREIVAKNLEPLGSVLDIGCGHADWLARELDEVSFACGLDPDHGALLRNRLYRSLVVASAENLPFKNSSFDLVILAWVLEHLEAPPVALREISRVLKPGGRLVFLTPNAWNYNVWLIRLVPYRLHDFFTRRFYDRQKSDTFPVRYRLNSPRRLERELKKAGLRRRQLILNGDPTYISFYPALFILAKALEWVLDRGCLQYARVHILGVYERIAVASDRFRAQPD
jgi:SAM-dependent methyltransferase